MPNDPADLVKRLRYFLRNSSWTDEGAKLLAEAADHIGRAAQPGPTLEQVLACIRDWNAIHKMCRGWSTNLCESITALYAPASPPVAPPSAIPNPQLLAMLRKAQAMDLASTEAFSHAYGVASVAPPPCQRCVELERGWGDLLGALQAHWHAALEGGFDQMAEAYRCAAALMEPERDASPASAPTPEQP